MNVSPFHFEEVIKKGYSLDIIYMLYMVQQKYDLSTMMAQSARVATMMQTITRKGLVNDNGDKLTIQGQALLDFMNTKEEGKLLKRKPATGEFEEFWKAYPGTDTFSHGGKSFQGSRSLRVNKDDCRVKFDKILLEGEYTATQVIEAMKFDVLQKKNVSVKTGENKLRYMQNSLTYLNQRSFEPFIELLEEQGKDTPSTFIPGPTDIN